MNMDSATNRKKRGFNLIEVLIAVFILVFMALMFAAVVPTTLRSVRTSNYYSLAALIAQRKIDQLMDPAVGYVNLTTTSLKGGTTGVPQILSRGTGTATNCAWIDPAPTTSGTFGKRDYRLTGYFTQLDGLRQFTDDGSDTCSSAMRGNSFPGDDDVVGRMDIEGWQSKNSTSTDAAIMKVTITITWRTPGQDRSTYRLTSLIPKSKIL